MTFSPEKYQRSLVFAAQAHAGQLFPGTNLPYLIHLTMVTNEVLAAAFHAEKDGWDLDFAVTCALLHDTLEDTATREADLEAMFGLNVLRGVRALTKDSRLPKEAQMSESLARILEEPREIAMVKLADRISNLQAPPHYWSQDKRIVYQSEARQILSALGAASPFLRQRLAERIESYRAFIVKDQAPR